jgi:hypothetical protein
MSTEPAISLTSPRVHASLPADITGKTVGSFELKFLLADPLADEILKRARACLAPDPHADHTLGDGYRVHSLYFDTTGLDVYHRIGSLGRRKFRLRRYGSEPRVFLERKSKSRGLVRKRRTVVSETELTVLADTNAEQTWPGHWFHRRLAFRKLAPKTHVSYERAARVGLTPEGTIRLTVDRHIRCRAAADLSVPCLADGAAILTGQTIVEFKFRVAMPALFKDLIHEFALTPSSVSKYRLSVEACGLNNGHKTPPIAIDPAKIAAEVVGENLRYA